MNNVSLIKVYRKTICENLKYRKNIDNLCRCWLKILNNSYIDKFIDINKDLNKLKIQKNIYKIISSKGLGLIQKDINTLKNMMNM